MHAASPAYCAPCVRHTNLPQTRLRHAPGARRAGWTLAAAAEPPSRVSELLGGTSIFIVGDNTTANQEVATALAARLGCVLQGAVLSQRRAPRRLLTRRPPVRGRYAPVDTAGVIQQLAGQTFAAIAEAEGADSSALAEAQIIEQLCTVGRVVVSTYGGGELTVLASRRAVRVLTPACHHAQDSARLHAAPAGSTCLAASPCG